MAELPTAATQTYKGQQCDFELSAAIENASTIAHDLLSRLSRLAHSCEHIVEEMDFHFLLDPERKVFTIGYNVGELRPDNSFTTACFGGTSGHFCGDRKRRRSAGALVRMGRQLTSVNVTRADLMDGHVFEYLMPLLVVRNYEGTLLNESYRSVVPAN